MRFARRSRASLATFSSLSLSKQNASNRQRREKGEQVEVNRNLGFFSALPLRLGDSAVKALHRRGAETQRRRDAETTQADEWRKSNTNLTRRISNETQCYVNH